MFKIVVAGMPELSKLQLVTEIVIDRRVYEHSRARITLRWDEQKRYGDRQTANIAAKLLNSTVDVEWKDANLTENIRCFHGYVERVSGTRDPQGSLLVLECVSFSQRADLIPRYRAFQACKLHDICQKVAATEPLIEIEKASDLQIDLDLSVQYGETDFEYLGRMLHAWGLPMSIDDKTGQVKLGARGADSNGEFPDITYGWSEVTFTGMLAALPHRESGGSGPTSTARGQVGQFNGQLKTKAADYFPIPDAKDIRERVSKVNSQVDTAHYRLLLESAVLPYDTGQVVKFDNQDCLIRRVRIVGHPQEVSVSQEFELQPYTLPYTPYRRVPKWHTRTLWAHVTENENDPEQSGRIQVQFEWEPLDPQSSSDRCWIPTLTPYGGGKSPSQGKAGEYNGFYSLPEVGERVLVHFLGDWDSDAVVIGTVREKSVNPMFNAKNTKRWRTPSGNEVTLTTDGSDEVVRIRCKDKIFFEGKMSGPNATVYITPGESDADRIHIQKGAGPPRIDIECSGDITVKAGMKLHLEGQMVQVKASGGNVNIDGAPNVMINCVPMPAMPLQVQKYEEKKMSTKPKKQRSLPTPAETTAKAQSGQDQESQKKRTWIEITLKDDQGNPMPGERYRIKLPDGTIQEGRLDADGRARVDDIEPGTAQVCFPEIDANEWRPA
jgi:hypothetical protein